jgi:hypothetical protein
MLVQHLQKAFAWLDDGLGLTSVWPPEHDTWYCGGVLGDVFSIEHWLCLLWHIVFGSVGDGSAALGWRM